MAENEFTVQQLKTQNDVEQYLELMRAVFGSDSRVDVMVKKIIDHHPTVSLDDFFLIEHHGRAVAGLGTTPSRWSIGDVPLDVAELSCVATLPEYRNRGLQTRLMVEYHGRVLDKQYDLSAIEGIPYYYRQFGYDYALPLDQMTKAELERIPKFKINHVIRPFTSQDVHAAKGLFERNQSKFYVHTIRDDGIWKMQQETGMIAERAFERFVVEKNGAMIAFFTIIENSEAKELLLKEITDVNQEGAQSILGFVKHLGEQKGMSTFAATISQSEPFTEEMVKTCAATKNRPYAWQIRITDHARLLRKMKPLFQKRLAASTYNSLTEKLKLNFYIFTVAISIENGVIENYEVLDTCEDRNVRFNPIVFAQLVLGYRSREELENIYPDFIVRPSHKGLIDILFPKLPSYIHTEY